jgi:pimeloyl-ACP methyl ester carboxylesterase
MYGTFSRATTLLSSSSRLANGVLSGRIDVDPRSRTGAEYLPWDPEGRYGGICGSYFFGDIPRREHVPVVFVHGNTADATDWLPLMERFLDRGDTGEDHWAITFRRASPSHDSMVDQLDAFVRRIREYTGHEAVHVVAHSLGVTGARYWLARADRYDWVDSFVGIAGANHGSALCQRLDRSGVPLGTARARFLNPDRLDRPDHPLARLNENETPGDVDYYTIRATKDRFFPDDPTSPRLAGATNVAVPGTHDGLLDSDATFARLSGWLRDD